MFSTDRASLRTVFFNAWAKHARREPLEPLEEQIAALLHEHPECQAAVSDRDGEVDKDYLTDSGQSNPFLHLSLHLAIRDQAALDRPPGIRRALTALAAATGERHAAEHLAMEQLLAWMLMRDLFGVVLFTARRLLGL